MTLLYCMAGQRLVFKIDEIDWIRRNGRNVTIKALLCVVCVCLFVCARPAFCGGIHGAFLPGLLMRAVRLPDNLAKKNLHSKRKHRHADPGNDGEGNLKEAHKHRQLHTHVTVQTKENADGIEDEPRLSLNKFSPLPFSDHKGVQLPFLPEKDQSICPQARSKEAKKRRKQKGRHGKQT